MKTVNNVIKMINFKWIFDFFISPEKCNFVTLFSSFKLYHLSMNIAANTANEIYEKIFSDSSKNEQLLDVAPENEFLCKYLYFHSDINIKRKYVISENNKIRTKDNKINKNFFSILLVFLKSFVENFSILFSSDSLKSDNLLFFIFWLNTLASDMNWKLSYKWKFKFNWNLQMDAAYIASNKRTKRGRLQVSSNKQSCCKSGQDGSGYYQSSFNNNSQG